MSKKATRPMWEPPTRVGLYKTRVAFLLYAMRWIAMWFAVGWVPLPLAALLAGLVLPRQDLIDFVQICLCNYERFQDIRFHPQSKAIYDRVLAERAAYLRGEQVVRHYPNASAWRLYKELLWALWGTTLNPGKGSFLRMCMAFTVDRCIDPGDAP